MVPPHRRLRRGRALRLEVMESRLMLAASPMADFSLDYLAEPAAAYDLQATAVAGQMIGLDQVRAEYGFTGSGQTVAIIDTGVAYDHLALGDGYGPGHSVVGGYDFTAQGDADPYDDGPMGGHGTHVAGILASTDARAPGIAPDADIVALRVFDDQGLGQFSWVEEALAWVHTHRNSFANPITTVNLSLGTPVNAESVPAWAMLEDEFAQLEADGIFIAVAAGNGFATYHTDRVELSGRQPARRSGGVGRCRRKPQLFLPTRRTSDRRARPSHPQHRARLCRQSQRSGRRFRRLFRHKHGRAVGGGRQHVAPRRPTSSPAPPASASRCSTTR